MVTNTLSVHFSSNDQTWETPQAFFDELNEEFGFVLDVCALPETAKCANFYAPDADGLAQDWLLDAKGGWCWMNSPYGREIKAWIKKAAEEAQAGARIVALLPARTDTAYWHEYIWDDSRHAPRPWVKQVRFIRGRLRFGGATNSAPFPSVLVIFDAHD
jgi:phage N-6-adenine-methyltransferase